MKSCLELNATMVANEFIDCYMAEANGEYVKVYLYIQRHQGQIQNVSEIADALDHTESDIKRALVYWMRQGVLEDKENLGANFGTERGSIRVVPEASGQYRLAGTLEENNNYSEEPLPENSFATKTVLEGAFEIDVKNVSIGSDEGGNLSDKEENSDENPLTTDKSQPIAITQDMEDTSGRSSGRYRKTYTPEQVSSLAGQEDFTQLLYIAQKYMNKTFTPRECEVFAYLYDALHMSAELLEYLVEYCVQGGHFSIRYLESVALDWHKREISNVDMAKEYTSTFSKEGFAVMRAFGIVDRRPGDFEQILIRKWFWEFGFTKDIVMEACSRTLQAIYKPSFPYTDKILSEWNNLGVRDMEDIRRIDEKRKIDGWQSDKSQAVGRFSKNQFHNFEQRNTNYDAMMLERVKEKLGER